MLTQNPILHAQWLNSLSYLEYRGLRMILRSQHTTDIDVGVLGHVMEEARHALYFKKLALKIGGELFTHYTPKTLLSESYLKSYFYNLNHSSLNLSRNTRNSSNLKKNSEPYENKQLYELMTWIIEERALAVYEIYNEVLKSQGFEFNLDPILADETKHLNKMRQQTKELHYSKQELQLLDDNYFQTVWSAFQQEVQSNIPS